MAYEFYFSVKGKTQGQLKGEAMRESRADQWMVGLSFAHQIQSPRDVATGRASGKRQHGPIVVAKEWGPATPQLMQALATNEMLDEVNFEFIKTNDEGIEYVYHKISLVNATVSKVEYNTGGSNSEGSAKTERAYDTMELESISFTYQKIVHENTDGSTMAEDDWIAQGG